MAYPVKQTPTSLPRFLSPGPEDTICIEKQNRLVVLLHTPLSLQLFAELQIVPPVNTCDVPPTVDEVMTKVEERLATRREEMAKWEEKRKELLRQRLALELEKERLIRLDAALRLLSFSKAFGKALILLFPVAEEYIQVHDGYAKFRWPILAIVGATRWGKTMFAGHVFGRIGEQLSLLARLLGDHGGGL
ncbi:hypothetical protein AK812_SmicGene2224 [Symbiodinium microadriaticum]|uniref:Uncharacterized protein n=1 Tax=Symbiodinium microadriaticum TaxID=2951 RepID=A0A1Q9F242_SYMMI|nr:hypothetical protein AK812_SmicGene2224 [Symbiodinium microadriaticum]